VFGAASPATQKKLTDALGRVIDLRARLHADAEAGRRWLALKKWQSERLAQTYADLLASDRYRESCEFFLEELYGARDFEQRDQEVHRVVPKLAKMLPGRALETLVLAVELDEISEEFDAGLARLVQTPITASRYADAYRQVGSKAQREHQVALVHEIGRSLDRLARIPMLAPMLGMMKGPAEAWGYGHLHHFLYRGFHAFAGMGGADDFLGTIQRRELAINARLFAQDSDPFRPVD
jgi:hypothetical protein